MHPAVQDTATASPAIDARTTIHPITDAPGAHTPTSPPTPIASASTYAPKPAPPAPALLPRAAQQAPPAAHLPLIAGQAEKPSTKLPTSHDLFSMGASVSQWCMTYSPYTSSGNCKATSDIRADVASIASKGFSSIRIYSTDCNGLPSVASAASSHGLNLILGVYISDSGISSARPQIQEIISWAGHNEGRWQAVEMIVVGNEAVFNDFCTAQDLAAFVTEARSAFRAAGYSGPVTTAETVHVLTDHRDTLCPVSDVVAANIHPFFNGQVPAPDAGRFVADQLARLEQDVCPGKEAWNLETGWPKKGDANGKAVPGTSEQAVAILSIRTEAGGRSAFFSFVDDEWKGEGELGVERNFGCGDLFL
ncbi:MAG: hypothetical protein Q9211_006163 [Gyalolechia sp. 1 TL-2023]